MNDSESIEMTVVLVHRHDGRWMFRFELADGTCLETDQSWGTRANAEKAISDWYESIGATVMMAN